MMNTDDLKIVNVIKKVLSERSQKENKEDFTQYMCEVLDEHYEESIWCYSVLKFAKDNSYNCELLMRELTKYELSEEVWEALIYAYEGAFRWYTATVGEPTDKIWNAVDEEMIIERYPKSIILQMLQHKAKNASEAEMVYFTEVAIESGKITTKDIHNIFDNI